MLKRSLKILTGPLIIMCLLGSGPVRDGTDVTFGGGYRQSERTACYGTGMRGETASWRYQDRITDLAVDVRRKDPEDGFIYAGEAEGAIKYVPRGSCTGDCGSFTSDVGHVGFGMHLAFRFGYQWEYFGFMGGPGLYAGNQVHGELFVLRPTPESVSAIFPSLELWVGNRAFHVFFDAGSNMAFHNLTFGKVGVEGVSDHVKIAYGGGLGYRGWLGFADVDAKLGEKWWLGLSGDVHDATGWATMLRFTYEFDTAKQTEKPVSPSDVKLRRGVH